MMTQLALKKCEQRSLTVEECCQCQLGICLRQQNLVLSNFLVITSVLAKIGRKRHVSGLVAGSLSRFDEARETSKTFLKEFLQEFLFLLFRDSRFLAGINFGKESQLFKGIPPRIPIPSTP